MALLISLLSEDALGVVYILSAGLALANTSCHISLTLFVLVTAKLDTNTCLHSIQSRQHKAVVCMLTYCINLA